MLLLLVRSTIFSIVLCQIIVLFGTTNAAIELISNTNTVEKILIDSVSTTDSKSDTSAIQPDIPVPSKTEEASASSSMQLDVPVAGTMEEPKSTGLCAAEEKLKLAFCQLFLENEIIFGFSFEERTGNFVCERRKIVLTTLNQSNLGHNDHINTYQCPQIVESVLLPEIYTYHVSQAHADSPVIVYTQRNSFSHIHPFKAVSRIDLAALANTNVRYYDKPGSLLEPTDLSSWNENADELVERAKQSIEMKKLTRPYRKFEAFYHSFSPCGLRTYEKLFVCKYYVFARQDAVTNLETEADVDVYAGSAAYKGSECRRYHTISLRDDKSVGLDLGRGVAQFRCPPVARYEMRQGTSALVPKIYFDHTVRLVSSLFAQSAAFLLDARYHRVALAATVSGIEDGNLAKLQSLRTTSRWRANDKQVKGSYQPARQPHQYAPVALVHMSRDLAEEAIYVLKGHASLLPHERFVATYPKITLSSFKTAADKLRLCNAVFGHQMFGYEIVAAQWVRQPPFELYVNRLHRHINDRDKKLACFSCTPSQQTAYAELFVAGGPASGGVVVLVRDFKSDLMTPLAVSFPEDALPTV